MDAVEFVYDDTSVLSSMLGTVYGNCCGDAIGLLSEFMKSEKAQLVIIVSHLWFRFIMCYFERKKVFYKIVKL